MSNDTNSGSSFFTRDGWWWASAVMMLIVVLGLVAILVLPGDDSTNSSDDTTSGGDDPAAPLSSPADPGTETPASGWDDLGCNGTEGSTEPPTTAPEATWEPLGVLSAPSSDEYGPAKKDGAVRTCYQHSPTGAVFAAVNAAMAFNGAADSQLRDVVMSTFTAGPRRDEILAMQREQVAMKVDAFNVESCSPSRCNVSVVLTVDGNMVYATSSMIWSEGDWLSDGTRGSGGGALESVPPNYVVWGA